ncbi:GNAT family N-acetyltransferase [Allorhizocola rhizosphaerae]|uniref:GNAT family N-acetyltransferase n=1 Tax=Allorhizocola rhizosphaerae TaxID=1872709 RepID=UPI0013C37786|nr:GNAT family N-acetyltransferase [Allorhizocola rhizosphaerae]
MQLDGYLVRRPGLGDARDILAIETAHNVPLVGDANATLDDVIDELNEPAWSAETDGWLVRTEAGEPVGYGWVCRKGQSDNVDVAVYVVPGHDRIAPFLWEQAVLRAKEIARELGHPRVTIDVGLSPKDELVRGLAERDGLSVATTFLRMRIDHDRPVPYPPLPDGVELRDAADSADIRRDAFTVRQTAFADHFGAVERTFEDWVAEREANSSHDWRMVHVAYVDGVAAAALIRTNNFVPDLNCGYVLSLSTLPGFRRRGLAGFLLRYAFAADAADGRVGTVLHVDTNPQRPALGLYQRAGMREVLTIDVWRKTLPT